MNNNINIPDGFELVTDDNYVVQVGDLYFKKKYNGDINVNGSIIMGWAGRILGDMKERDRVLFVARKTGIMSPYFAEKPNNFPHGF